jgi:uncharacterized protein (DUF1778 family)
MILSQAARARHMNTSQFVLQVSLDAADAVLRDQTVFTPSTLFHITIGVPSVII